MNKTDNCLFYRIKIAKYILVSSCDSISIEPNLIFINNKKKIFVDSDPSGVLNR